jgi:hypothetical protein
MQVVLSLCVPVRKPYPGSPGPFAYTPTRLNAPGLIETAESHSELQTRQSTESPSHEWLDSAQLLSL